MYILKLQLLLLLLLFYERLKLYFETYSRVMLNFLK